MSETTKPAKPRATISSYVQNTILVGVLTAAPLVVTWFVLSFLFKITASAGRPAIEFISHNIVQPLFPQAALMLTEPAIENGLAFFFVVIGLFLLGFIARNVIGGRILQALHNLVDRIPFANKLYGSVRKLIEMLQTSPNGSQRIVLVDFPSSEVRAVGIVTRTMRDKTTGEELAAVYVPTTPNPTNGYLEVVPVSKLVPLDMSMDDAMSFVISGGAVGPTEFNYRNAGAAKPPAGAPGA